VNKPIKDTSMVTPPSERFAIGSRVWFQRPSDDAKRHGVVLGTFVTSPGDPAVVINTDDGDQLRLCCDRVKREPITAKGNKQKTALRI